MNETNETEEIFILNYNIDQGYQTHTYLRSKFQKSATLAAIKEKKHLRAHYK
jgi:hypothetical protein